MANAKLILTQNATALKLTQEQVNKLKKIQMMMLDDIYASAKKRNINIMLTYGSLLGAVRHQGYIPWDDDIDLMMFNDDMELIINAIKEDYGDKYYFSGSHGDRIDDPFFALKVILDKTIAVEAGDESFPFKRGISIDIFPLVRTYKNRFCRAIQESKMKFLIHANAVGYQYKFPPLQLKSDNKKIRTFYKIRRLIGFFTAPFYKHNKKKLAKKFAGHKKSNYYILDTMIDTDSKAVFDKQYFSTIKMYKFEDKEYPSVDNPEVLLTALYGPNYMELPPENKREQHIMYELDFGDY